LTGVFFVGFLGAFDTAFLTVVFFELVFLAVGFLELVFLGALPVFFAATVLAAARLTGVFLGAAFLLDLRAVFLVDALADDFAPDREVFLAALMGAGR
jgi:hypothetical protein